MASAIRSNQSTGHSFRSAVSNQNSRLCLFLFLLCSATCATAAAQSFSFGAGIPVGTSSRPLPVSITIQKSGLLNVVQVVGQGNDGVDFVPAGSGSCITGISYPAGQTCTVQVSFVPKYPGVRSGAIVLTAQDGTALGTQYLSGTGVGGIGTFTPGQMSTVAGQATWLYNGDGQSAINASLFLPFGIAVDSVGNLFIADQANNRVRKVTAATGLISTIAGNGILGAAGDGGLAIQASLSGPSSVAIDGAGNLYVSDSGNSVVRKIAASTGIITSVAGTVSRFGYSGDGAKAIGATLNLPNGVAVDSAGNLYIADTANNVIRRVDAMTGIITTVAGTGIAGFNGNGGLATATELNAPWSMTPAPGGLLYIADQGNHQIRLVDAAGFITTVAGTGVQSFSGDNGPASYASLNAPASVAIDVAGNIYIADSGNNRMRKIASGTGVISTIAGQGNQSVSGDNGPATAAGLYGPYSLALDGQGDLFIADVFHNRIREVAANSAVINFAPMRIGRVATTQLQTLENDGNTTLNVGLLQAIAESVVDSTTTTCSISLPLAPLNNCLIGVAFAPTRVGTPDVGSIAVNSDAVNTPGTIELSGNVLSQDPSTVTIAAGANPINVGGVVTFTVTASSGGTIPTGPITLTDGGNVIGTANMGAGGIATFQISNLTGGQHKIVATYAGDINNTSAVSAPWIETVTFITAPTQTTLTAMSNPAIAGVPVTFTATIAVTTPGSGTGSLSGPVTFTDGGTIIGIGSISGSAASISAPILSVGQHSIIASYAGTPSFAASSSSALILTIQAATTSTSLTSTANPSYGGETLVLTASVTGNGARPTGTVVFFDGSKSLGIAVLSQTGQANLSISNLALGTHTIIATYTGDALNNSSVSTPLLEAINIASTTVSVSSIANPSPQGNPVTLTAKVGSNGGIPTGTIQFFDGTASLGIGTLDPTGKATLTSGSLNVGSHSITANYRGDALDSPSTSLALVQVIAAATSTVSFTSSANPSPFAAPLVLSVLVQGTGPQPTGTITLQEGASILATQSLSSAGLATFSNLNLAIGAHSLVALYSGDSDHAPNNSALALRIVQITSASLTSSAATAFAGTPVTWTAIVSGRSGQSITGTVQFIDGAAVLATVPVDATGTAVFTSTAISIGTHALSAVYSGDMQNQASNSNPLLQSVQIATTLTSLSSSASPSFAGASVTLLATVSSNGAKPTGPVTFNDGTSVLGATPVASGTATLTISTLAPGPHFITATYSGDPNNASSVSAALTEQIAQQTTLTITSSANPAMLQSSVTITVTCSGFLAAFPPSGTVTLTDGSVVVGAVSLNAFQSATFTLAAPTLGQHTLLATYSGDTHNSAATSLPFIEAVTVRPTTISLTTSATSLSAGQQVTFVSVVQGVGPTMPTGIVTFVSGSTVLGTAALNAGGVAILVFLPQQAIDTVVAQYPGDSLFSASASNPVTVVIGPTVEFTLNAKPGAVSIASGAHTTLQVSIFSAPSFSDTISLGCAGLPASATCTFSQDQIKVSSGTSTTLSVVIDTGNPLGAGPSASLPASHASAAVACILPGGLFALLLLRPRRLRKQFGGLAVLIALSAAAALSGCASSLRVSSTPPGTYAFTIIGTGAASGATQTESVSLTVTR